MGIYIDGLVIRRSRNSQRFSPRRSLEAQSVSGLLSTLLSVLVTTMMLVTVMTMMLVTVMICWRGCWWRTRMMMMGRRSISHQVAASLRSYLKQKKPLPLADGEVQYCFELAPSQLRYFFYFFVHGVFCSFKAFAANDDILHRFFHPTQSQTWWGLKVTASDFTVKSV